MEKKIKNHKQLKKITLRLKNNGKKIVYTNGCFDLIHVGHIRYLEEARKMGDCLIVGLNSDSSVRRLKGKQRPLISEKERAEILAALEMVDYVTVFDEPTSANLLLEIRPDIYVKGGDYTLKSLPERNIVNEYGGQIRLIPEITGYSTSAIIKKIGLLKE